MAQGIQNWSRISDRQLRWFVENHGDQGNGPGARNELARREALREIGALEGEVGRGGEIINDNRESNLEPRERLGALEGRDRVGEPGRDYSVQGFLDYIGWDGEEDRFGRDARQIRGNITQFGSDGGGFGYDENAIYQYFDNLLPQNISRPIQHGMDPITQGEIYGPPGTEPEIVDPVGNEGVDLTEQPDYFDPFLPNWNTGSSINFEGDPFSGSVDNTWNADAFGGGSGDAPPLTGGGLDPNDFANDFFVPGEDSPWGIPGVVGGNNDFYRNQFIDLLRGEQNFQNAERAAQQRQADLRANPPDRLPMDWSWTTLPEVEVNAQGYASPIPGVGFADGGFGYQQNSTPAFILDPVTGEFQPFAGGILPPGIGSGPQV